LTECLFADGKILACGNGGSAADAQHFAAELVGRFERERPELPAISLSTDTSLLTAVANDYSFEQVFAKQVRAGHQGRRAAGDFHVGQLAQREGGGRGRAQARMRVIAMTGKGGGQIGELMAPAMSTCVPHSRTARIQEVHLLMIHCLCDAIDATLLGDES
jgi:D-sedoheptulose 7-phosphate isomerase